LRFERVLWELRDGPLGFRPLQHRCDDMSSSVLSERLGELEEAQLVRRNEDGHYALTPLGRDVGRAIEPLDAWSKCWARGMASLTS
jgi:DNA-binding HxlR family transcriptional regulator